jgi:glucosamine kinase
MAILIADSGSTKTDWALSEKGRDVLYIRTAGLNPYFTTKEVFTKVFGNEVVPKIKNLGKTEIFFYGAGCGTEKNRDWIVKQAGFFNPSGIEVGSDLLGAARAILQKKKGIACILGTGSNAGLYEKGAIIKSPPSLGYVLGDEGGGGWLGIKLVQSFLRSEMPPEIHQSFKEKYIVTRDDIIRHVYHEAIPNRYLAEFAGFTVQHRSHPWIKALIMHGLFLFFEKSVLPLETGTDITIGFTGAVSVAFADMITEAASSYEFYNITIEPSPIKGLVKYHCT